MPEDFAILWKELGLDSLLGERGDLRATITRDWECETVRVDRSAPVAERADLPRISLAPPVDPTAGARRPEHELAVIGLLGEGGMGKVLLARQNALSRVVAVKVAHADASRGAENALVQEARTTGALEHPGVIPVHALASDSEGRPALVMKRVEGVPWSRVLDGSDPGLARRIGHAGGRLEAQVDILIQVCNTIAFAHSRGVLHRDIKPENVLLGDFGEVYVADWGVAISKGALATDARPAVVGTPCYLAPEMATGQDARMDERTDVFLLGSTLYEVMAGRPPWTGANLREVCRLAWACDPPPLPTDAPEELVRICRRAMAREPAGRYPSVSALREALGDFLRHRGSVRLSDAAGERLRALQESLRSGKADRAALYSLLSECRFGFTQSLREWPDNAAALLGLRECLMDCVRHEIAGGNGAAARALLSEVASPPPELEAEVRALEAREVERRAREERLRELSKELDPRVSIRQRRIFLATLGVTTVGLVTVRNAVPAVREAIVHHGAWYMVGIMAIIAAVYTVGLWLARDSLLGNRVNRHTAAVAGAAIYGSLCNRLLAVLTGIPVPATLVADLCLMCAVCSAGGLVLHWGYLVAAGLFGLGAIAGALFPQHVSPIFGAFGALALTSIAVSWRNWRGELDGRD